MKNKRSFRIIALLAALMAAILMLASCKASNDGMAMGDAEIAPTDKNNSVGSTLPSYEEKGEMADSATGDASAPEYAPKIIRTANLTAETQDFGAAVAEVERSVAELGGYIESCTSQNRSRAYDNGGASARYANYILRIPAENLDAFLAKTGELLHVTSSSAEAKDISGEYYDMEARISVLETERALVEKMLSEATSINTMIDLEKRLYDIIYEIESYKTAIKVYDSKVAYSTVNLYIHEVASITPVAENLSFGARFKNAAAESWKNTVELGEELLIALVYLAPFLIVAGVLALCVGLAALVIVLAVRRKLRKSRENKA